MFFYFLLYGFFGWVLENMYSLGTTGVFFKENFLRSPIKPMYGIAPVLLIYSQQLLPSWSMLLFLCLIIPTVVEYTTGAFLEKFFQKKWWDYSELKFQFRGHICLYFSLCWAVLSLAMLIFVQPFVARFYHHFTFFQLIIPLLMLVIVVDITATSWRLGKKEVVGSPVE